MSNRTLYLVGLVILVVSTAATSITLAVTGHLGLAGTALEYGGMGSAAWAVFKSSDDD